MSPAACLLVFALVRAASKIRALFTAKTSLSLVNLPAAPAARSETKDAGREQGRTGQHAGRPSWAGWGGGGRGEGGTSRDATWTASRAPEGFYCSTGSKEWWARLKQRGVDRGLTCHSASPLHHHGACSARPPCQACQAVSCNPRAPVPPMVVSLTSVAATQYQSTSTSGPGLLVRGTMAQPNKRYFPPHLRRCQCRHLRFAICDMRLRKQRAAARGSVSCH